MKLLIVEDELELLHSLSEGLTLDGYYVDEAVDGETALDLLSYEEYDLVILDINLPDISGFDIVQHIKIHNIHTKILILTAKVHIEDKVKGLDLGADDYLTKPFDFMELEARIRTLLRRQFISTSSIISFNELELNTSTRKFYINKKEISLTKKEMAIIEYLMLNQDRIISSEELLSHVWDSNVNPFSNSIRVHFVSLRKKIKETLGYNPIINKVGEGYFLKKDIS